MRGYLQGVDAVLGATAAGRKGGQVVGAAPSGRGVLITVKDVPALVRAQGGATGALAQRFLPDTIENTVYQQMAAEIASGMKDKGVDADVKIVSPVGFKPASTPEFTRGAFVGAGAVGIGWLAWKIIKGLL